MSDGEFDPLVADFELDVPMVESMDEFGRTRMVKAMRAPGPVPQNHVKPYSGPVDRS
jgi:hypothetical protein